MLKKLAAQTAIYGISSIIARFLNYLLTPYLTRIMTTGEYGVVTDLYALIPFILLLLTMGMETGYFHFAGKAGTSEEKRLINHLGYRYISEPSIFRFHLIVLTSFVGGDGLCRNSVVSIIDGKYYNRRCCDGLTIR